ncbi:MAG TPA: hemerythrin domain-containing protein [Ignavibacteriaceae bacterium]|nr:hemerythrin domain-containing protein [Ignavibacteriaceae bacterium]
MKRHPALVFLSKDHHHGLIMAQMIKKDAPNYKGLPHDTSGKINYVTQFYRDELKYHFDEEENILFSYLAKLNNHFETSINNLKLEHQEIEDTINSLENSDQKEIVLNDLGVMLEQHIRFEERILFEKIQNTLSEEELDKLTNLLNRSEQTKKCN